MHARIDKVYTKIYTLNMNTQTIIVSEISIKDLNLSQIYKGANLKNINNKKIEGLFGKPVANEIN